MTGRLDDPLEAARAFVDRQWPESDTAFVAGSVIRGEGTATSDLDLVVVGPDGPYRESFRAYGWPIEAFVHTPASLTSFFEGDAKRRRPSLPTMVAEGRVVRDRTGRAETYRTEAHRLLAAGPAPLPPDELETQRYMVTDLLEDLEGATRRDETVAIAGVLAEAAAGLWFDTHGHWRGTAKWLPRALRQADAAQAERLFDALEALYRRDDRAMLIQYVDDVLAAVGGRLFEGYARGKAEG